MLTSTNAVMESAEKPQSPSVSLKHGATLTGAELNAFIRSADDVEGAARTRLQVMTEKFAKITHEEFELAASGVKDDPENKEEVTTPKGKKTTRVKQVVSQRLSELRTLFVAIKTAGYAPPPGRGYHSVITGARDWLKNKNLNKNGEDADVAKARKAAQERAKIEQSAMEEAMKKSPREEGERMADYMIRIESAINEEQEAIKTKAEKETIDKIAADVIKTHGSERAEKIAIQILAALGVEFVAE